MIHTLFSTSIYRSTLPKRGYSRDFLDRLRSDAGKIEKIDSAGRKWSQAHYPHGYTSYGSLTNLQTISSNFLQLQEWIDREVGRFSKSLRWDLQNGSLSMSSFWINRMGKGAQHSFHLHPHSVVSGTFYLTIPKEKNPASCLKLEDPRLPQMMAAPIRPQLFVELQPKEGELILFESWLKHEVPHSKTKQDRVSVSFNYFWNPS